MCGRCTNEHRNREKMEISKHFVTNEKNETSTVKPTE